jgi:predicted nuclease of restriction endonuclease-like (RecB) superfamily
LEANGNTKYLLQLLLSCSFSHIAELIKLEETTKRKFYELLILKTTPSVRELQRQIYTLTYERVGFSQNKEIALKQIRNKITPELNTDLVKTHYFFEFLNLKHPELVEESDLENALINQLQEFIMELGNGFCFESRQKRILIGDEYFFIDLVFYHRILKCHVLIELKTEKVNHEHIGQLKTHINYYKKNYTLPNDNPPVGILLVTTQNKTLVEYAIADSDKDIFVSQYLLQLPDKEQLVTFINEELKKLEQ